MSNRMQLNYPTNYLFNEFRLMGLHIDIPIQLLLVIPQTLPLNIDQPHTMLKFQHKRKYLHVFDEVHVSEKPVEDHRQLPKLKPYTKLKTFLSFNIVLVDVELPLQLDLLLVATQTVEAWF